MSETFDHAKELVEKNPVATAGALAVAGLALYLSRGQIMSFFKPSVEAGAELAEMGAARSGLESVSTLSRSEIPVLSFGEHAAPQIELPGWVKTTLADGKRVNIMPPLVMDGPLSTRMDWAAFDEQLGLARKAGVSPITTDIWKPLEEVWKPLEEGHLSRELGLGRVGELRMPSSVHWRLPDSREAEIAAGLMRSVE